MEPSRSFEESIAHDWLIRNLKTGKSEALTEDLTDTFKFRSKQLARVFKTSSTFANLKLMSIQEALANALGFPRTHALQQSLDALPRLAPEAYEQGTSQLVSLVRLRSAFEGSTPLVDSNLDFLERMAGHLSKHLDIPRPDALSAVACAWAGASDWQSLCDRTPLTAPSGRPFVKFTVEGDPNSRTSSGRFTLTDEGDWLWDNVLGSEERAPLAPAEAQEAFNTAMHLAKAHPEFMVAWAAASNLMATYHEALNGRWGEAKRILEKGINQANRLMPKGFKGQLDWGDLGNRPYLRSLYQLMRLWLETAHLVSLRFAFKCANKMLRVCPDDNMGVRFKHPLLAAVVSGNNPATKSSIKRALRHEEPSGQLHAGLAMLLLGDNEGVRYLLEAVFRVPNFGALLLNEPTIRPFLPFDERPRGYEDLEDEVLVAIRVLAEYADLRNQVRLLLSDSQLLEEEARLEQLLGTRATGLNWEEWELAVQQAARTLGPVLAQRYRGAAPPH